MPSYFFQFSKPGGNIPPGDYFLVSGEYGNAPPGHWQDCASLEDAHRHALQEARDLREFGSYNWWGWKMVVTDTNGNTVFENVVDHTATPPI
jgi:hypothetical protein